MQPINIFDLIDKSPNLPPKGAIDTTGVTLYGTGGFLKKDPSQFTRKEKYAYIKHRFSINGGKAEIEKFVIEVRCSYGFSDRSYKAARQEGLAINAKTQK